MASNTCTNTAYTAGTNCTTSGFGCTNPTDTSADKCICGTTSGFKTNDDGSCTCTAGYYKVTGSDASSNTVYSCNKCTDNDY